MAKYLLTGAAGFIGARTAQMLLDSGQQVVGVDNLDDAYDVRMKERRLEILQGYPNFEFHRADISNSQQIAGIFKSNSNHTIDAILNLAARAGVRASVENPWVYVDTNITGTLNLLNLAKETNIKKFVLASTSSIYGENPPLPTPESAPSDKPLQPYAASKKGAEALCHAYHYLDGIDVTIFRYFTVYGPYGRPNMAMFRFVQWIAENKPVLLNGDGSQTRGFTHVDDIARGTILGLKPLGYEIINLGGHEVISMIDLISIFETLLDNKAKIEQRSKHPADMSANHADITKARTTLGWEPNVGLQAGVQNLVEWYLEERDWAKEILTA